MYNLLTDVNERVAKAAEKLEKFGYARVFFANSYRNNLAAIDAVEQTFRVKGCYVRRTVYATDFAEDYNIYGYLTICPQE